MAQLWHDTCKQLKKSKIKIQKNQKLTCSVDFDHRLVKVNGDDQIESFLRKWGPNWDNEKLENQTDITWQIEGPKE